VRWATRAAQRHGIQVGMFLMWGYEGETLEDIAATVEHVKEANPDVFFTTVAYPIKDTAYYGEVADRIVSRLPWGGGARVPPPAPGGGGGAPPVPAPRPPLPRLLPAGRPLAARRGGREVRRG